MSQNQIVFTTEGPLPWQRVLAGCRIADDRKRHMIRRGQS
jgi:hypothetical protein